MSFNMLYMIYFNKYIIKMENLSEDNYSSLREFDENTEELMEELAEELELSYLDVVDVLDMRGLLDHYRLKWKEHSPKSIYEIMLKEGTATKNYWENVEA